MKKIVYLCVILIDRAFREEIIGNYTESTMAIALKKTSSYTPESGQLKGKSKFWGFPDMPANVEFPYKDGDPMCFICQINMEELHAQASDTPDLSLLPRRGMLYFFAQIDYFLGWSGELEEVIGLWSKDSFRVLYTEDTAELFTHKTYFEDHSPAAMDAWEMRFESCNDDSDGHKLLGCPFFDEVPSSTSLLQIDEDDDWGLRFFDSGMINFIIDSNSLMHRDFSKTELYFHTL